MIALRVLDPDEWPQWRSLRLCALRESPEAFGSRLCDWLGEGDTEERWRRRLSSVALNLVAALDGRPAGMVSGARSGADAEVMSLWVAPFARGCGVGEALVGAVLAWAASENAGCVVLDVRAANRPAARLYLRLGFVDAGESPHAGADEPPERRMVHRLVRA